MVVTKFHSTRLPAEHARNLYQLSVALVHEGKSLEDNAEAEDARLEAEIYLKRKCASADSFGTAYSYDKFIHIFYR
jgi:hypothetical protein